jgi:valyl-tRNA synthetase
MRTANYHMHIHERFITGYRNFCNKLWNATRFALTYVTELQPTLDLAKQLAANPNKAPRDCWILSRLNAACTEANRYCVLYVYLQCIALALSQCVHVHSVTTACS